MTDVSIDWDKAEGKGFELVPKGTYKCEISQVEKKETEAGNPYIAWRLKIVEPADQEGQTLFLNTSLLPQSLWKTSEIFTALGLESKGKQNYDLENLIGKLVWGNVVHEQFQGTLRARVESTRPCADQPSEKLVEKEKSSTIPDLDF